MSYLKLNTAGLEKFVNTNELQEIQPLVTAANTELRNKSGAGNYYIGWIDWPEKYNRAEFKRIEAAANKIKADSKVLVVIGIGGSYLGAKMAVDFTQGPFAGDANTQKKVEVIFAGNSLSASYLHQLLQHIGGRDFSVNVISKSGTTTEPAIAFRVLKQALQKKYGKQGAKKRIYVTTDAKKGSLHKEAITNEYETFVIPDDIGGRFSVLTSVGLLPIAVAGANIQQLMQGAQAAEKAYSSPDLAKNTAYRYAALRNILYRKGYTIELLESYEPALTMFAEWWKQLMGETEGKDNKGIFPASASFSTDLHSLGQYIQSGPRNLMETVLVINELSTDIKIPMENNNDDGLQYLEGQSMNAVNHKAYQGVVLAHNDGGVPVMSVIAPKEDEYTLGYLIYFFEIAVAISGYLNGINPFNQPGVEAYKTNMFALLDKPGFETLSKQLKQRLDAAGF